MIPTQTLESFPIFGSNATKVEPGDAKKAAGWQQADVVPAEWMNWEWYKASKGITDLNSGVSSIEKELNSVLTAAGNTPSESTDNQLLTSIMKVIHPVGSLWWTSKAPNNGGDPNVLFGGTWTQIKDRFILAAGDTYTNGATGGERKVTLELNNIPGHTHSGTTGNESQGHTHSGTTGNESQSHTHGFADYYETVDVDGGGTVITNFQMGYTNFIGKTGVTASGQTQSNIQTHTHDFTTGSVSQNHTHDFTTNSTGGDSFGNPISHNNMPPYVVKYCWERTA